MSSQSQDDAQSLSADERKWLKDNWGGEFHFLRCYSLSIYKEEDREEGRLIMRALIKCDDEDKQPAKTRSLGTQK